MFVPMVEVPAGFAFGFGYNCVRVLVTTSYAMCAGGHNIRIDLLSR